MPVFQLQVMKVRLLCPLLLLVQADDAPDNQYDLLTTQNLTVWVINGVMHSCDSMLMNGAAILDSKLVVVEVPLTL